MPKIVLQAGHINCQNNSDPALRTQTGAPGEQELTLRITDALAPLLQSKGFTVIKTDANANDNSNILNNDWDFFLALHGDANVYGTGGGCITAPDPSVDQNNARSRSIVSDIEAVYFPESGIVDHPERINANMTFYYMWSSLTAKTPCGLLEMGVVQDPHDSVILADTQRVAAAIARGICKAFNVNYDAPGTGGLPVPPPPPHVVMIDKSIYDKYVQDSQAVINSLNGKVAELQTKITNAQKALQ
jgi:N-acetylmuramoyl-L-alanine amidase